MHNLRAILNNPIAINKSEYRPLTQGRERVGASPQVIPTSRARFSSCRKRRLRKRRTVAARPERGCGSKRIPTAHARIGAEGLENTDLPHKECRPFAQRIPTFRAKDTDLSRKGLPTAGARDYRLPAQERRRIPTSRTSNTDLSRKATLGNTCKSMHLIDRLPFPCCSCMCLMFCCSKRWEDEGWEGKAPSRFAFGRHHSPS